MPKDEQDVEGHVGRYKFRDEQGNEFEIPEDRIKSVTVRSGDGTEVEGHFGKFRFLDQGADVEGHAGKVRFLDDKGQEVEGHVAKVRILDDKGNEQDVEGQLVRYSDLGLKRDVEPLGNALARLVQAR